MTSPLPPETDALCDDSTWNPDDQYYECEGPYEIPLTMVDQDGSTLQEYDDFRVLEKIVSKNDTEALEQYFTIAPWVTPRALALLDEDGRADPFCLAASNGCLGVLKILLAHYTKDKDPTLPIRFKARGYELLNVAARRGRVEVVQFLLENQPQYASIHERDPDGYTAVASAADIDINLYLSFSSPEEVYATKNEAMMNLLLDRGACASDVVLPRNDKEKTPDTVLTLAAQWAGPDLIKRLITSGADVHAKVSRDPCNLGIWDEHGCLDPWDPELWNQSQHYYIYDVTAFFVACLHANMQAIETLIEYRGVGVDVRDLICSPDSCGGLPLHWATRNQVPDDPKYGPISVLQARIQNVIKVVNLLLDIDPSTINIQDNHGNTPLHYATCYLCDEGKEYTAIFELLCNRGADASIRNNKRETPLHTLIHHGARVDFDTATISILLSHGAKATDVDGAGNTPLHFAAENLLRLDTVSLLLEQGADASIRDAKQDTPAHIAARGVRWSHGGVRWNEGLKMKANEKIKLQDDILQMMIEAGGAGLMDLPNAEGKSPREICQKRRDEWRKAYNAL
ncbi:hypothetical protein NW762_014077 [Fusarium torreyae]|uniref:Ankyrin n=1 Tax=Fusarium torreyae TaxID=1237075 RepID=A0A9W8RNA4_9HYPO|nr:hypothetical protein NW762_014077 [Fusarium torreyae]